MKEKNRAILIIIIFIFSISMIILIDTYLIGIKSMQSEAEYVFKNIFLSERKYYKSKGFYCDDINKLNLRDYSSRHYCFFLNESQLPCDSKYKLNSLDLYNGTIMIKKEISEGYFACAIFMWQDKKLNYYRDIWTMEETGMVVNINDEGEEIRYKISENQKLIKLH